MQCRGPAELATQWVALPASIRILLPFDSHQDIVRPASNRIGNFSHPAPAQPPRVRPISRRDPNPRARARRARAKDQRASTHLQGWRRTKHGSMRTCNGGRSGGTGFFVHRTTPIARSDGTVLRLPPPLEVRGRALILGSGSTGSRSWIGVPPANRAHPWRLGRRWMAEVADPVRRRSNDILMAVKW